MKQRLFAYLILLPLLFLLIFTDISMYLNYIAYVCIPIIIGLIIYAYIKTKAFYKIKKCLIFLILGLTMGLMNVSPSTAQYYGTDYANDSQAAMGYYLEQQETIRQERVQARQSMVRQRTALKDKIARLSRKYPRTTAEERELQDALAQYSQILRSLGEFPCPTTQQLYDEAIEDCWACDMAELFIVAGDKVATTFYQMDKTQGYSTSLLIIGFMFWLVAHVLKLLMSFGTGYIGSFFTELFVKLLLVGGIFILLLQPMYKVVDFAVSPFFLISSAITRSIMETSQPSTDRIENKIDEKMEAQFGPSLSCPYCEVLESNFSDWNGAASKPSPEVDAALNYRTPLDERVVSPLMRNTLLCTVCTIYKATVPTTITGQFIACSAKKKTDTVHGEEVYSDWGAVITGYTMIFSFFLISAFFAFYLLDTFVRIAITLVLLPFLIVAWAFKSTQKYTVKGFEVLLHSVATYIMITLFLVIIIQLFYVILGPDAAQIVSLTAANNVDDAVALAGWTGDSAYGGRIFLCSVGILVISWFCLSKIDEYVTELTGISLSNSGGFQAMMTTIGAGTAIAGTVSKLYSQEWKKPGDESGNNAETKAAHIREWGESKNEDGWAEQAADKTADSTGKAIEKGGDALADGSDRLGDSAINGAKACYKIPYVGAIIGTIAMAGAICVKAATTAFSLSVRVGSKLLAVGTKLAIKYGGRTISRTLRSVGKMIARNKYFNKTVGAFWQGSVNIKNTYNKNHQRIRNAHAAYHRYQRRRKKRK